MMKKVIFFSIMICALSLFTGCDKDEENKNNGILSMRLRTWNNYEVSISKSSLKSASSNPIRLPYIDMNGYKYEMKFTTDVIQEGMKDSDINWVTVYESDELKKDGERDFQFNLPAGEYKGFALWQGRDFFWVCDNNGDEMQIPASNGGENVRVYNAFGPDGLYILNDDNELEKVHNDEFLGVEFNIIENKTTILTVRTNITAIDWNDNDSSGTWTDGDSTSDFILPDGINTMSDFIVVYE